MKKQWHLLPKILNGTKTVESRWYKAKMSPWDNIKVGDTLYFKDSGNSVTVKARVTSFKQHIIKSNSEAFDIMKIHALDDLGVDKIPNEVINYIADKKYAIFVWFDQVQTVKPFKINKTGFGSQAAWISAANIKTLRLKI